MTGILQIILFFIILTVFHELGHIISARILNLSISKIGLQLKPYPSAFVAVKWPKSKIKKNIYLFSGTFITLCLFSTSFFFNFFDNTFLYLAFCFQLIAETNPFYSDFTIAIVTNKHSEKQTKSYIEFYKEQFSKYQFSLIWYLHFISWIIIILTLVKFKNFIL